MPAIVVAILLAAAKLLAALGFVLLKQAAMIARITAAAFMLCAFMAALAVAVLLYMDYDVFGWLWGAVSTLNAWASWSTVSATLDNWRISLGTNFPSMGFAAWVMGLRGVLITMASTFSLALVVLVARYTMGLLGRNT